MSLSQLGSFMGKMITGCPKQQLPWVKFQLHSSALALAQLLLSLCSLTMKLVKDTYSTGDCEEFIICLQA